MTDRITDNEIRNVLGGISTSDKLTRDILANYLDRIQELEREIIELRNAQNGVTTWKL